jgi:hypothetical protein
VDGLDSYADLSPEPLRAGRAEIVDLLAGGGLGTITPVDTVAAAAERLVVLVHRLCAIPPTILVVDDIHWVDPASMWVLQRLSRLLRQLPLLLVIAVRPVLSRTEVDALRSALSEAGALTLAVGPLTHAEATELVRLLLGGALGPALAERLPTAGGNRL